MNDKKLLARRLAIYLILATIFEFSNLGAIFLEEAGEVLHAPALTQLAQKSKIQKAHAATGDMILPRITS